MNGRKAEQLAAAFLEHPRVTDPQRAEAVNALGRYAHEASGDAQKAVALTLAAIGFAPEAAVYHLNAASLALQLGQRDRAREHLEQAVALDKAQQFEKRTPKQIGSALSWYLKARSIHPQSDLADAGAKRLSDEILAPDGGTIKASKE